MALNLTDWRLVSLICNKTELEKQHSDFKCARLFLGSNGSSLLLQGASNPQGPWSHYASVRLCVLIKHIIIWIYETVVHKLAPTCDKRGPQLVFWSTNQARNLNVHFKSAPTGCRETWNLTLHRCDAVFCLSKTSRDHISPGISGLYTGFVCVTVFILKHYSRFLICCSVMNRPEAPGGPGSGLLTVPTVQTKLEEAAFGFYAPQTQN